MPAPGYKASYSGADPTTRRCNQLSYFSSDIAILANSSIVCSSGLPYEEKEKEKEGRGGREREGRREGGRERVGA